jgi:hypothetical protein
VTEGQRDQVAHGLRAFVADELAMIERQAPLRGALDAERDALAGRLDDLMLRAADCGLKPGQVASILNRAEGQAKGRRSEVHSAETVARLLDDAERAVRTVVDDMLSATLVDQTAAGLGITAHEAWMIVPEKDVRRIARAWKTRAEELDAKARRLQAWVEQESDGRTHLDADAAHEIIRQAGNPRWTGKRAVESVARRLSGDAAGGLAARLPLAQLVFDHLKRDRQ